MRSLYIYINNIQQRERELGENWSEKIIINVKKLRPRQFFFKKLDTEFKNKIIPNILSIITFEHLF